MTWGDTLAYVFNRTALGVGVLWGCYSIYRAILGDGSGWWIQGLLVFFVLIPVYFYLHRRFDAP